MRENVFPNKLNLANKAILSMKDIGSTIHKANIKYINDPAPELSSTPDSTCSKN